jgi:SAV_6107-like HEPN
VTWTQLLANRDVQRHRASKNELDAMRALIARDLADAAIAALSADRRFATAYNAALQAANMAIGCAGYRVTSKTGHHKIAFDTIRLTLGAAAGKYADYFETCRRKRNVIDYTHSHVATETESKEILEKAAEFYELVEAWIAKNHAALKR